MCSGKFAVVWVCTIIILTSLLTSQLFGNVCTIIILISLYFLDI